MNWYYKGMEWEKDEKLEVRGHLSQSWWYSETKPACISLGEEGKWEVGEPVLEELNGFLRKGLRTRKQGHGGLGIRNEVRACVAADTSWCWGPEGRRFIVYTPLELRISTRLNLADEDPRGTQTENLEAWQTPSQQWGLYPRAPGHSFPSKC